MRYVDARLSSLLAERKVAEAQSRPTQRDGPRWGLRRFRTRLGSWLISLDERPSRKKTEPA